MPAEAGAPYCKRVIFTGKQHRGEQMDLITDPQAWIALATLTALEAVLGIDNIIFIAILASKLPQNQQSKARRLGLAVAMATRILLLFSITWVMKLTAPLFSLLGNPVSGRDLILIVGGLFLLAKSTYEIHHKLEGSGENSRVAKASSFSSVIIQIMILDMVFSLDSVITAVGMVDRIAVMITAVIIAVLIMMAFADAISNFVERHPTIKMLALSFLLMIGFMLVAEGFEFHIPKGYAYFAMGFSVLVEILNIRAAKKSKPVHLHGSRDELEAQA
jgi:predicted tellurium resistance membrane protein TerC